MVKKKMPIKAKKTPSSRLRKPKVATPRSYVSQSDVPICTLEQALRIPRALGDDFGYKPTTPLHVAASLEVQPKGPQFRRLTGSAVAYGLITGGAQSAEIGLTELGLRAVRPTVEGDDLRAKREALLQPRIIGEFLKKYDGAPLPRTEIAANVLIDMGVPKERAEAVRELIVEGADSVGAIKNIKGKNYVDLHGMSISPRSEILSDDSGVEPNVDNEVDQSIENENGGSEVQVPPSSGLIPAGSARRVFITHGRNRKFLDPIKKLLGFGELEAVVSVERTSVAQPLSDKVMNDMRSCGAAIIHVDAETTLIDKDVKEHTVINSNVLIEIGAAMALYGRRFILLVKSGIDLPSNLQGLFEVRYQGESLDGEATIKLLEAINDIKNHALPDRYSGSQKDGI